MSELLPAQQSLSRPEAVTAEIGVLFVDLDGSLVASNMLVESFLRAVRHDPKVIFKALLWLTEGRIAFKSRVADYPLPDVAAVPFREEVVAALKELKHDGCRLVLATASHRRVAEAIAAETGLFDDVLATDETCNLKGRNKLAAIQQYCREHGFDEFAYLGDSWADVPIWERAAKALVVAPSRGLRNRLSKTDRPVEVVVERRTTWKPLLKALRPHQWMKNILVFLPLVLAHDLADAWKWVYALIAFVAFSACASAVYLVNDLVDLEADRRHPTKRKRPFASGRVPVEFGFIAPPVLLAVGLGLSLFTADARFSVMLLFYLVCGGLYCLWLKRMALVDVFLLSGLYMLRVQAGGTASAVPVSEWLLIFSLFFFLSLAFAKRFVELDRHELAADTHDTGRGYRKVDVASLSSMGSASGYIAVLVLALYINSPQVLLLYKHPKILCILCPILLFWMSRLWMLARRNELHDDPVVFALKDRMSQLLGALSAATVLLAWLLN
jgi:4-hydroxybenzoate polyprenyltransferase/phosphoglycolate phosphatase-like HAD superfamily hydrolase